MFTSQFCIITIKYLRQATCEGIEVHLAHSFGIYHAWHWHNLSSRKATAPPSWLYHIMAVVNDESSCGDKQLHHQIGRQRDPGIRVRLCNTSLS